LNFSIPLPSIYGVTVVDTAKSLSWTGSIACISYKVEMDATSNAFTHIISTNTVAAPASPYLNATTVLLSDPDYFDQRWFRITPYDDLSAGTPTVVSHVYTPSGVVQFNGNEVVYVSPPPTPIADPVPPIGVAANPVKYIEQSWSDYTTNKAR